MSLIRQEKKIAYFIIATLIAQPLASIVSLLVYPPDFSGEFPVYDPDSIMLMVIGGSFLIAGLTVMGIQLGDEKKVLPAAGFTMFAISGGILMASLFEISHIVSLETYEKFYRIQSSANFLYLPAMYLISTYEDFKKWIRYIGLVSAFILLISSFMFLFGNRNFKLLETISNIGFLFLFITTFGWAYNVYINFKKTENRIERI